MPLEEIARVQQPLPRVPLLGAIPLVTRRRHGPNEPKSAPERQKPIPKGPERPYGPMYSSTPPPEIFSDLQRNAAQRHVESKMATLSSLHRA